MSAQGRVTGVYAAPAHEETAPAAQAVLVDTQGRRLALYENKLYALDEPGLVVAELQGHAEDNENDADEEGEGVRVTAVEHGPADSIRVHWRHGDELGWSLMRWHESTLVPYARSTFVADASAWKKFIEGRVTWGNPDPMIGITLLPEQIRIHQWQGDRELAVSWPRPLKPVATVISRDHLYVVELTGLSEVNLGIAVNRMFEQGR